MRPLQRPTLAVFDLDNTLYEYAPAHDAATAALIEVAAEETGIAAKDVKDRWDEARRIVKERLGRTASSHSRLLYAAEMLERIGFKHQPKLLLQLEQEYWRAFLLAARLRAGAEDLLVAMRYNDVRVAIVTDLTAQIQLRKLVHFRIDALIDHLVSSEETPQDKWSMAAFELALDRVDPPAREHVWFIGDGPDDTPVDELLRRDRIGGGHGFVLGPRRTEPGLSGWTGFADLERAFTGSLGRG